MTSAHPITVLATVLSVLALSQIAAPVSARRATAASGNPVFSNSGKCFSWDYFQR